MDQVRARNGSIHPSDLRWFSIFLGVVLGAFAARRRALSFT